MLSVEGVGLDSLIPKLIPSIMEKAAQAQKLLHSGKTQMLIRH